MKLFSLTPIACAVVLLAGCSSTPVRNPAPISTPTKKVDNTQAVQTTPTTLATTNFATANPILASNPSAIVADSTNLPSSTTTTVVKPINNNASANDLGTLSVLSEDDLRELNELLYATDVSMVEGDSLLVNRYGDVWQRLRNGYKIAPVSSARIDAQKSWFLTKQEYLNQLTARASRYLHHTVVAAETRGLPTELALLPIIESSYDPSATSSAGAVGLWQFMPATGTAFGLVQTPSYDGRRDIVESTRAAYDYLSSLYQQFGSWELALAAYNGGPGRVARAIENNRVRGLSTDFWSLDLPRETQNYVPRFLAVAQIVQNPAAHGLALPSIANRPHFSAIRANAGATLWDISQQMDMDYAELQLLNPSLVNLTADSANNYLVVVPNKEDNTTINASANLSDTNIPFAPPVAANVPTSQSQPYAPMPVATGNAVLSEPPLTATEREKVLKEHSQGRGAVQGVSVAIIDKDVDNRARDKRKSYDSAPQGARPSKNTQTTPKEYVVKNGDSLTSVAAKFGMSLGELAQYNDLTRQSMLIRGQRLSLVPGSSTATRTRKEVDKPKVDSKSATTSTKNSKTKGDTSQNRNSSASTGKDGKTQEYTIKGGDTLIGIAEAHDISPQELAKLNGINAKTKVRRGETIKVPKLTTTYKVQSGDTLIGLAKRYDISPQELAKLNGIDANTKVRKGQALTVPNK